MGRRTFPKLAGLLIDHGLPPETPAVIAEGVTTAVEHFKRSTVGELAEALAKDPPSKAPTLIFYGALAPGISD